jgi:tRNA U38,U39,U40 pseudouridine synthase TruA
MISDEDNCKRYDIDVPFVHTLFQKLEGIPLKFNAFAYREWIDKSKRENGDVCTLYRARAFVVNLDLDDLRENANDFVKPAMCVELVGDRFLRRMVRILVATACRESLLPLNERDPGRLLDICKEGDRGRSALAISGVGLAMSGVGYNLEDFSKSKHGVSKKRKIELC